jgi:heme/copper-type cytochrome/quinol oxidase subunit 4
LNIKRRLHGFVFAIFLTLLAITSALASTEVITYNYDDAGQVK